MLVLQHKLKCAVIQSDAATLAAAMPAVRRPRTSVSRDDTLLMLAADHGHARCVQLLAPMQAGARTSRDGRTALMRAAGAGYDECVSLLLVESGGRDARGHTALMLAAKLDRAGVVAVLATHEAGRQADSGKTALMYASRHGHLGSVRALLSHEARLQDVAGRTALIHAAQQGRTEVCELLLAAEAGQRDQRGHTALWWACRRGQLPVVELLLPHELQVTSAPKNQLERVCRGRECRRLVGAFRELSAITTAAAARSYQSGHDAEQVAALWLVAARTNKVSVLTALAPGLRGRQFAHGRTALMEAVVHRAVEAVRVLAAHEAGAVDQLGRSASAYAAWLAVPEAAAALAGVEEQPAFPAAAVTQAKPVPAACDSTCPVCLAAPASVALMPCGHCLCESCEPQVRARSSACPICRQKVAQTMKLHFA
jgi:hypothetical protein